MAVKTTPEAAVETSSQDNDRSTASTLDYPDRDDVSSQGEQKCYVCGDTGHIITELSEEEYDTSRRNGILIRGCNLNTINLHHNLSKEIDESSVDTSLSNRAGSTSRNGVDNARPSGAMCRWILHNKQEKLQGASDDHILLDCRSTLDLMKGSTPCQEYKKIEEHTRISD